MAQYSSTQKEASSMTELGSALDALSADLRTAVTSLSNPFEIIPKHVKQNKRLKVATSRIPNLLQDVV